MNTYRITAIDVSCNIITAIDIINIAGIHQHAGCIACREPSASDCFLLNGVLGRIDVSHTTTAIDIVHLHVCGVQHQIDTLRVRHGSLVTTAIEVTNQTAL